MLSMHKGEKGGGKDCSCYKIMSVFFIYFNVKLAYI